MFEPHAQWHKCKDPIAAVTTRDEGQDIDLRMASHMSCTNVSYAHWIQIDTFTREMEIPSPTRLSNACRMDQTGKATTNSSKLTWLRLMRWAQEVQ